MVHEEKSNRKHTKRELPTDSSQSKVNLIMASPGEEDS